MTPRIPLPPRFDRAPFTFAEARRFGVGEGRLRGADLARPFHGVRDAPEHVEDVAARCHAYASKMPETSFFSSTTAAELMGVPLPTRLTGSTALHVAIVSPHRGLEGRGVIGHKVQLMGGDTRQWNGLRISSPERTWCELGRSLTIPQLTAVGDYLIHWRAPLTTIERLDGTLARYPDRRGRSRLRIALGQLDAHSESPMESELRSLLLLAGVSGMVANFPVLIAGHRYRLDIAIPARKLALEYQGDYHRDPAQWRADMTRRSRLESEGWFVIEVNAEDLRDPAELVARIQKVIATRPNFP